MKKFLLLGLLTAVLAGQASALGLGAAFTAPIGSSGVNPGAELSFKLDNAPYVFGLGVYASNGNFHIGATADLWMAQGKLIDFLNYYVGPGLYAGLSSASNVTVIDAGLRIPVGINAFLLNNKLEFFFELAPALGLATGSVFQFPTFGIQTALGFRFWF